MDLNESELNLMTSSPTRLDHEEPVGKYHVARKNSFQLVSNRTIV